MGFYIFWLSVGLKYFHDEFFNEILFKYWSLGFLTFHIEFELIFHILAIFIN